MNNFILKMALYAVIIKVVHGLSLTAWAHIKNFNIKNFFSFDNIPNWSLPSFSLSSIEMSSFPIVTIGIVLIVLYLIWKIRKTIIIWKEIRSLKPSFNPRDYKINIEEDTKRESEIERGFRKEHFLRLLNYSDCKCMKCGTDENGVDLDHAFLPKKYGGNFILTTKTGVRICNAMILCQSCNRSKGIDSFDKFFKGDPTNKKKALEVMKKMTERLNRT